ncbi:MAG: glycosyltransferase family 39 protein [Anaerolineales bacterium]|nr:glycosyltransferase family 39 protein [Anaerolineales bacterium]MCB8952730.1 glycosyltransferase family 39 protein [Ardenticatenales bacterium]
MQTTLTPPATREERGKSLSRPLRWGITPAALLLAGIIALSAFLHFYRLDNIGDGNLYYTAAVKSMLQSWHNFFFVAAEPGGSVTVDKPPLGLWIEAASAFVLGVNGLAVVLPNILAGLLSLPLIYHLVRRYFGSGPGLLAALAAALTPVSLAAERNNTMDGMLTFCLLLAAWAFLRAVETERRRFLWLGAALVGVGFNIKMMQAFMVLPAFYALYFFGSRTGWGRKIVNLLLATILLLLVSLWWPIVVDLTPADQRPFIGSSTDNTVMELIAGHNGLNRWFGPQGSGGNNNDAPPNDTPSGAPNFAPTNANARPFPGDGPPPGGGQLPGDGRPPGGSQAPGGGGPGGSNEVGSPGVARFFQAPLSKEISWLLPFALIAMLLLLPRRLTLPLHPDHRFLLLWGGWLLTCLVFFSFASFFHAYYMVMLAPPLAALVGGGAGVLWRMRGAHPRRAAWLLLGAAAVTLAFQWLNARQFDVSGFWLPLAALLLAAGGVLLWWEVKRGSVIGFALVLASLLITPLVWSGLTVTNVANVNLPAAYQGATVADNFRPAGAPVAGGGGNDRTPNAATLAYLEARTQDVTYLLAVPSSMQGAPYVLATGRPVLYMGGFGGNDAVVSAADLAQMTTDGALRYVLVEEGGRSQNQGEISQWVRAECRQVTDLNTQRLGIGFAGTLYDCAPP